MRLINVRTLKLETFHGSTPPYAILSHTWGKDEITFTEDLNKCDKSKQGFFKIRKCCEQANKDILEWAWVDTCCIDKTSSAELSEAINSMYSWYQGAAVCYAYLEDVEIPSQGVPNDIWKVSRSHLRGARWLTRGWTLQELIAPREVVFYISGWIECGKKNSPDASRTLEDITGIDRSVLQDPTQLDRVSVARKMSWASKRETTRVEDIAYCLMGLFDVHMPLLYGEGHKAFVRLQEEIMKDSQDQSLFAWQPLDKVSKPPPGDRGKIRGRSIFAHHPNEFAASGDYYGSLLGEPYAMTNKGVRMVAPVIWKGLVCMVGLRVHFPDLVIKPNLANFNFERLWVGLLAEQILGGDKDQYVRSDWPGLVNLSEKEITSAGFRTIYLVKKLPPSNTIPLMRFPRHVQ